MFIRTSQVLRVPYRNQCVHLSVRQFVCLSIKLCGTCCIQYIGTTPSKFCVRITCGKWFSLAFFVHMTFDLEAVTLILKICGTCYDQGIQATVSKFGMHITHDG